MHYRVEALTRTHMTVKTAQLASSPDRIQQVMFSPRPEIYYPEILGSFLK